MRQRLRFRSRFLYFVLLWCVFSFKVFLGGVAEAGLRVDDLLIAMAFSLMLLRGDISRIPRSAAFRAYLPFISISICSAVWNGFAGRVGLVYSMLFVARLLEYVVFYYLGFALMESGILVWRGLRYYFYALCIAVPLQMMSLLPTASGFTVSRASGNTNGPYELAAVSAFFFCYFGYRERKRLGAAASCILLILTAARITLMGTAITFLARFVLRSKSKTRAIAVTSLAALMLWSLASILRTDNGTEGSSYSASSRLTSSKTLLSVEYTSIFAAIPTYRTSADYIEGMFVDAGSQASNGEADVSGMIRVFRWASLIKSATQQFDSLVIGLGPSFGSAAVDGYYVRVFIETGLAGLVAFYFFLSTLVKRQAADQSGAFREFVTILIVTACFIDIFASYKAMLLLWLWNGMNEFEARQKGKCV